MMLCKVLKYIKATSSTQAVATLLSLARAAVRARRSYKSSVGAVTGNNCALPALMDRGVQVSVLDFEISASEAVRRFEDYQRKACMYLHAQNLLRNTTATGAPADAAVGTRQPVAEPGGARQAAGSSTLYTPGSVTSSLTATYLPYWCFETTFNSVAHAKLGFIEERTGETVWKDLVEPLQLSNRAVATAGEPAMQINASYKYVRDVGGGAAGPGLPLRARPLSSVEAAAGSVGGVALDPASMRQGVAWSLALRALTHQQLAAADVAMRTATGAVDLRDVRVSVQALNRRCRLVFLPAYVAVYQYGTRYKQGTSGIIVPQVFTAVVGGAADGKVVAPEHLCPAKTSLSTGAIVGGGGLLAGDWTSWAANLLGLESLVPQLGAVEAVTLAALAASGAGLWAHQRPQRLRAEHAAKQVRADLEFYKKYDIHETYGSAAASAPDIQRTDSTLSGSSSGRGGNEEYVLWLWSDADWRRWEHDEPWNWDEDERRRWAEDLWRKQAGRRLERQRYIERMVAEAQRRTEEEAAEARRERLYGSSTRSSSYSSHRPQDHGLGGDNDQEATGVSHEGSGRQLLRRRSDFLGYYLVLGLQDAESVSSDDVKQAFKVQALMLHPDKHVRADQDAQRAALVKFQKLQMAYDTLKDAEKRRLYDRGQLVQ